LTSECAGLCVFSFYQALYIETHQYTVKVEL